MEFLKDDITSSSLLSEAQFKSEKDVLGSNESPNMVFPPPDCSSQDLQDVADADADIEEGEIPGGGSEYLAKMVCNFYQQGSCALGSTCRFLHLSEKGLYRMFDSPGTLHKSSNLNPMQHQWCYICPCVQGNLEDTVQTAWDRALKEASQRTRRWDEKRLQCKEKLHITLKEECSSPKARLQTCDSHFSPRSKWSINSDKTVKPKVFAIEDQPKETPKCITQWDEKRLQSKENFYTTQKEECYPLKPSKLHTQNSHVSSRTKRSENVDEALKEKLSAGQSKNRYHNKSVKSKRSKSPLSSSDSSCYKPSYLQEWLSKQQADSFRTRNHSIQLSSRQRRTSCSTSSSSSMYSPPLLSVSKRVSIHIDRRVRKGREKSFFQRPNKKHQTKFYRFMHRRERDVHPEERMSPINLSPTHSKVKGTLPHPLSPMNCSENLKLGQKKMTVPSEEYGLGHVVEKKQNLISTAEHPHVVSVDMVGRWTPKKVESPSTDRSCRDMSISPFSDSSLCKIFEPTEPKGCRKSKQPEKDQDNKVILFGAIGIKATTKMLDDVSNKRPKLMKRKLVSPLERDLLKFHRVPGIKRSCSKPFSASATLTMKEEKDLSKSKKELSCKNAKCTMPCQQIGCRVNERKEVAPSKKAELLRRLQEINAAIERKKNENNSAEMQKREVL